MAARFQGFEADCTTHAAVKIALFPGMAAGVAATAASPADLPALLRGILP